MFFYYFGTMPVVRINAKNSSTFADTIFFPENFSNHFEQFQSREKVIGVYRLAYEHILAIY